MFCCLVDIDNIDFDLNKNPHTCANDVLFQRRSMYTMEVFCRMLLFQYIWNVYVFFLYDSGSIINDVGFGIGIILMSVW